MFGSDITPADGMYASLAEVVPGGGARQLHSHAEPEIYYIIEGTGILMIDDIETAVTAGAAVFIPATPTTGPRNESEAIVRLFYVPTGRYGEIVY